MKILLLFFLTLPLFSQALTESRQVLVGIAPSWDSSQASLSLYERKQDSWIKIEGPISARLGKNGLAWGLGIHQNHQGTEKKREGDGKSPAGMFYIGGAWGYARHIHKHPSLPYRKVTSRDLWIEDSNSPSYNQHQVLSHEPKNAWEKKAQMKQNDHAHSLKLFIAHNAPPRATPFAGSAIFFHIWREQGARATAGCTTMSEANLKALVSKIDPTKKPVYVLLPKQEYEARRSNWQLP
jgi:L,D-peptidoglycan transpeptidase YkuD (ErfK/YbiS/YcfS/YnhG family)